MRMRYLVFTEMSPDDMVRVRKAYDEVGAFREKHPDRLPKMFIGDHILMGDLPKLKEVWRSVTLYEADDPKQLEELARIHVRWTAEFKSFKRYFVPIVDQASMTSRTGEED